MECYKMRLFVLVTCLVILVTRSGAVLDCSPQADIPCQMHKFKKLECSPEILRQKFDFYETNTTKFPGAPHSLDYSLGYRYYNSNYPGYTGWYPEANLTFKTPQNGAINFVKGFEIIRYSAMYDLASCYILDLSNVSWGEGDSLQKMNASFSLELFPLPKTEPIMFKFEVYALPRQELKNSNFDQHLQLYAQYPVYVPEGDRTPRNWKATITFSTDSDRGIIHVNIYRPSSELGFTKFEYSLNNTKTHQLSHLENSEKISHNFTNVPSGNYEIWVKPIDGESGCACRDITGQICEHCRTTKTKSFDFKYTGVPVTTSTTTTKSSSISISVTKEIIPVTEETTKKMEPSTTESGAVSRAKVIGAVFGVIGGILLALLLAAIVYFYKCRRSQEKCIDKSSEKRDVDGYPALPCNNPGYADDIASIYTFQNMPKLNNVPKLKFDKQPKLFLLYEDDHEHHRNVVNQFATYLQLHCQCKVMCVEWQLDAPWVHQDLEQADNVVIVNSEGAYLTYMSKFGHRIDSGNEKHSLNRRLSSINSIRNKFLSDERYDNIVMVYFSYTDEKYVLPDICPGYKYQLPKNFTDFLLHVHKLHRTENLQKYDLPLDGDHSKRPIGQQFLESLSKAEHFQQQNPNWSQKKFSYTRMYSNCSDDSRFDSGLPEEISTPIQTPQVEKSPPFSNHKEPDFLHLLEGKSVCTVNPSDFGISLVQQGESESLPVPSGVSHAPKERPRLSPHSFQAEAKELSEMDTPPPHTCSTVESEFGFFPPDDLDDNFDVLSKTQSEQMKSIVDRYQAVNDMETSQYENYVNQSEGYDRSKDLYLLKVHSGEVPFIRCGMDDEVVSLGGESV